MKNDFENKINKFITAINKKYNNILGMKNNPTRNHLGTYISGEKFDYIIFSLKGVFCFDAKMTIKEKWLPIAKDIKQAKNILNASVGKNFVTGFFLIYFKTINDYRYIDIIDFCKIYNTRKYIKISDCKRIRLEEIIL